MYWVLVLNGLQNAPRHEIVLFWGVVVLAVAFPLGLALIVYLLWRGGKRYTEFYDDRVSANRATGELEDLVRGAEEVWGAWHTGTHGGQTDVFTYNKGDKLIFSRLILMTPDTKEGSYLTKYHAPYFGMTPEEIASDINITTRTALVGDGKNKPQVRHFPGPLMNSLLIGNPKQKNGWARVEIQMPHSDKPRVRPMAIIKAKERPQLFERLCDIYEKVWCDSEEVTQ